jgi:adenylosuccinate lyase
MPHKINPIDFENAEGNMGVSNALFGHLASKLPRSRWQRDLTDSTAQRVIGTAFGHSVVAVASLRKGLSKLEPDPERLEADLTGRWELMAEPVQTVMRRYGLDDAYEQLKAATRGKALDKEALHTLIQDLEIPQLAKQDLLELSPAAYTGLATELASAIDDED